MSLKKVVLLCLLAVSFSSNIFSQILEPVKWESSVEKISDTEFNLVFIATIEKGWYMYSQEEAADFGPRPTYFEYKNQDGNYKLEGKTTEPNVKPKHDKVFDLDVKKFNIEAKFTQRLILINKNVDAVEVYVDFQVCDDAKCILQDHTFNFALNGATIENKEVTID